MEDNNAQELAERIGAVLHGQEIDDVIPVLAGLLANAAVSVCSDKEVFLGYMKQVISEAYAEVDHSDEPLQ
tara:strand:- start:730 stop:942 length:213 start_codon:yes stop_codon:yes gene_type:complete